MATIASSTTLKERLDRIAALQQRGAPSHSEQRPRSTTPTGVSKPTASAFRDKIARFEEKGGTPVPKSTFGLWAPNQTTKRNNELYGNRIPSVKELSVQHQKDTLPQSEFLAPATRRSRSVSASNPSYAQEEEMTISTRQSTRDQSRDSHLISSLHIEARSPSSPSFLHDPHIKPKSDAIPPILDVVPATPLGEKAPEDPTEHPASAHEPENSEGQKTTSPKEVNIQSSDPGSAQDSPTNTLDTITITGITALLIQGGKETELTSLGDSSGLTEEKTLNSPDKCDGRTTFDNPDSTRTLATLSLEHVSLEPKPSPEVSNGSENVVVDNLSSVRDISSIDHESQRSSPPGLQILETCIQDVPDVTEQDLQSPPLEPSIPGPKVPCLSSSENPNETPSPNLDAFPIPPAYLSHGPFRAYTSASAPTRAQTISNIRASGDRTSISSTQSATPSLSFSSTSTTSSPTATSTNQTQQQPITQPNSHLGASTKRSKSHSRPKSHVPTWYDSDSGDDGEAGWASVVVTRRYY